MLENAIEGYVVCKCFFQSKKRFKNFSQLSHDNYYSYVILNITKTVMNYLHNKISGISLITIFVLYP